MKRIVFLLLCIGQIPWVANCIAQTVVVKGAMASVTPHSTSQSKNCVKETDMPVLDGSFSVSLDPSSITTFVSKRDHYGPI